MGFDYQPFAYGVYVCASPSLVNTREHNAWAAHYCWLHNYEKLYRRI